MWAFINRSLLKFALTDPSINPTLITGAKLRLYGKALFPLTVQALFTANDFHESTVTWDTQPPPTYFNGITLMGSTSQIPSASEDWWEIPLDISFVKVRVGYNFNLILKAESETGANQYCYANDKEGGINYAPQLLITFSGEQPTLTASLSASPSVGPVPLAVSFTIGIGGGVTPYTWTLDYGDGSTPGSGTVAGTKAHTYTKAGTFTATLTVTDALGASIASRSKVMAGVIIQSWVSVLAPLAVGAALIKVMGR